MKKIRKINIMNNINSKMELIVVLMYGVLLVMWTLHIPFGGANDEFMRFDIANFIFKEHRLPTLYDSSIRSPYYGFSYAAEPNLAYIVGAAAMRLGFALGVQTSNLYLCVRMTSVLWGILFSVIVYLISKELFKTRKYRWFFG